MFLVSMIARIMEPGCKCDYMLILEDERQGTMKSSACATLAGAWFSDGLPDLQGNSDQVRLSMHLRGKWLIEISDLSAFSRAETETLKAFITRREECYIPKYARNEVRELRQNVFIGTTNQRAYLRDSTGARRFWPTKTGNIDIESLARDRDQLFAEAVQAYRSGAPWWPDRTFEAVYIKPEQDARFDADAWETDILKWLEGKIECTVIDVARGALSLETGKVSTREQNRITKILEAAGWERGTRTTSSRPWIRRRG